MANLSEKERKTLRDIFDHQIKDEVFADFQPVKKGRRPTFVQLGGQLAAGKSRAIKAIAARHGSNVIVLSPDTLREYHEDYEDIMRNRPHDMVDLTTPAMKAWTEMVCDHAHKEG